MHVCVMHVRKRPECVCVSEKGEVEGERAGVVCKRVWVSGSKPTNHPTTLHHLHKPAYCKPTTSPTNNGE